MVRPVLRGFVATACALAVVAFVLGCLPGIALVHDGTQVATVPVVEHWRYLLGGFVLLLAPGITVWRNPQLGGALLWATWALVIVTILSIVTATGPDPTLHAVPLWPHRAFAIAIGSLVALLVAAMPIACGIVWLATRRAPVELPIARARSFPRSHGVVLHDRRQGDERPVLRP